MHYQLIQCIQIIVTRKSNINPKSLKFKNNISHPNDQDILPIY